MILLLLVIKYKKKSLGAFLIISTPTELPKDYAATCKKTLWWLEKQKKEALTNGYDKDDFQKRKTLKVLSRKLIYFLSASALIASLQKVSLMLLWKVRVKTFTVSIKNLKPFNALKLWLL